MRSVALSTLLAIAVTGVAAQDDAPKPVFTPTAIKAPFLEQFTDDWASRWTPSEATKKTPVGGETFSYVGKWEVDEPTISVIEGDKGLVAKTKAAHHAISAPSPVPSTSPTSRLSSSMRLSTRRAATAVVATSSSSRMASRQKGRNSLTRHHGQSCSVPT
ncbi:uncharacterized protein B0H18DRAFT_172784 [Fomitopsis serialis]|uniref:uncharacterized protein n=1 Tax=Fomitopsis serialis TaxID=139415 RepID=UPI0020075A2B|nr:uncharacterized protein B0H18DRAFT_172784 [Neoantrodia serialis]KAH9929727.1 hypothetical protein B0H18DRAFT_172784 [Neoantrodia serialis]